MGYEDIGLRIKERRTALDISAADLADRLSMSKATIHRYENGEIKKIKMPVIMSIARVLKVNPAWLLGKSECSEVDGNPEERHIELENLFGDLMTYFSVRKDLRCNGKPLLETDSKAIEAGLNVMWAMVSEKYE